MMNRTRILRALVRVTCCAAAIIGTSLGPPGLARADQVPAATAKPSYATVSTQATYYNPAGKVIARTPVSTARVAATGPTPTNAPARDGDRSSADAGAVSATVTPKMAASTTCHSGTVCGTSSWSGCASWSTWRTEVHQGITDYRYELDVYFCWRSLQVRRGTVSVSVSMSHMAPVINDGGNSESDNGFYGYFFGYPNSGHFSKYQRHVQYCVGAFCYDREDPWIHEYIHGDGTTYFHTGTGNDS